MGNALKDLVCAPRPLAMTTREERGTRERESGEGDGNNGNNGDEGRSSKGRTTTPPPPEIRLLTADSSGASEAKSLLEYGFPSSHVMNSLVLSLHAVECFRERFPAGLLPFSSTSTSSFSVVATARAVAVLWTLLVALARVACGMHTPVDVAGGLASGLLVVAALALEDIGGGGGGGGGVGLSLDARYVSWLASRGPRAAALHALATALLLRLHPLPLKYTTSFEATTAIAGACAGVALGVGLGGGEAASPPSLASVVVSFFLRCCLRCCAPPRRRGPRPGRPRQGGLQEGRALPGPAALPRPSSAPAKALAAAREVSVARRKDGEARHSCRRSGRPWDEVLTAKFFSYASLGWAVAGLRPQGSRRPGFEEEEEEKEKRMNETAKKKLTFFYFFSTK